MTIYLVRHGEVYNPDHVVYADLAGFGLSARGRTQAVAMAEHLSESSISHVISSPLERAVATAGAIAKRLNVLIDIDDRLTEWRLSDGWAGIPWEDLPTQRPGEVEAYLEDPANLEFASESLANLALRMYDAMEHWAARSNGLVMVSHQDPVHALVRFATGRSFEDFQTAKPGHASVTRLGPNGTTYSVQNYWEPDQDGVAFPPTQD